MYERVHSFDFSTWSLHNFDRQKQKKNKKEKKRQQFHAVTPVHGVDAKLCSARRIMRKPNTNKLRRAEKLSQTNKLYHKMLNGAIEKMDKWLKSFAIKTANVNIHFRVICTIYLSVGVLRRFAAPCTRVFGAVFSVHTRIKQQMITLFFLPVAFSSRFRVALVYVWIAMRNELKTISFIVLCTGKENLLKKRM